MPVRTDIWNQFGANPAGSGFRLINTTNTAAGQIKDANLEASRMRELSTVISGMARDMDRRIEEGMRQRY